MHSLPSVRFIEQRLLIAKEFGDRAAERRAYCNLGNAYIFLGEFEVAAEHYKYASQLQFEMVAQHQMRIGSKK